MSRLSPDQALAMPAGDLAALPSDTLFHLKNDAADLLSAAKMMVERIDHALDRKYSDQAHALRLAAGKDMGIVHFDDGLVRITADLPKKVEWDQRMIADLVARISAAGEDPAQYVEISYRVSETKFNAWPESLRGQFTPARTVKPGKPSFRLAFVNEQGA